MREVNNNTTNPANLNFQCIKSKNDVNVKEESFEEVTDLGKMPADVIGRSQVVKPAIDADIDFFVKNPEAAEKAQKLFDYLVDDYHMSYERAAEIMSSYAKEFCTKSN